MLLTPVQTLELKRPIQHHQPDGTPVTFTHIHVADEHTNKNITLTNERKDRLELTDRKTPHYTPNSTIRLNVNDPALRHVIRKLITQRILKWVGSVPSKHPEHQLSLYAVRTDHLL